MSACACVVLSVTTGAMTSSSDFGLLCRGYSVVVMAALILVTLAGARHNASTPGTISCNDNSNNSLAVAATTTARVVAVVLYITLELFKVA